MKCTAEPCNGILQYKGGENQEDYGCSNWKYPNMTCHAGRDIGYFLNVKVRRDWYFLASYHLPFRWIDVRGPRPDHDYRWYALVANTETAQTELHGLSGLTSERLHSVPCAALPANNDFLTQFHILRDRVMNEWLNAGSIRRQRTPQVITTSAGSFSAARDILEQLRIHVDELGNFSSRPITPPIGLRPADNVSSADRITLSPKLRRLIETATSDTVDDAAERAAVEACHEMKRWFRGSSSTPH